MADIYISIPDSTFTLDAGAPLVFNNDIIMDFNLSTPSGSSYKLGDGNGSTNATLTATVDNKPILLKKNAIQLYIIYASGDSYYKYLYSPGVSAPTLLSSSANQTLDSAIQKIITKFRVLFLITENYIYIHDFASPVHELNKIAITGSDYQFLRDVDGKIYAMPDGLNCTIAGNCNANKRLYIRTAGDCASYNGCDEIDELNNISSYLGVIYENSVL